MQRQRLAIRDDPSRLVDPGELHQHPCRAGVLQRASCHVRMSPTCCSSNYITDSRSNSSLSIFTSSCETPVAVALCGPVSSASSIHAAIGGAIRVPCRWVEPAREAQWPKSSEVELSQLGIG